MASNTIGGWAFIIGVILAVILGAFGGISQWVGIILVIIGLIVGFLNVTGKEVQPFMMAGVVLVIVTYFGGSGIEKLGMTWLSGIFNGILILFVPATIIVALKSVFSMARK